MRKVAILGSKILWAAGFFASYYFLYEFQYKWYQAEAVSVVLSGWMIVVFSVVLAGLVFAPKLQLVWAFAFIAFWIPMIFLSETIGWSWPIFVGIAMICLVSMFVLPRKVTTAASDE